MDAKLDLALARRERPVHMAMDDDSAVTKGSGMVNARHVVYLGRTI